MPALSHPPSGHACACTQWCEHMHVLGPQCSRSCGGGSSVRDVQCVDTRHLRPLRPFHCQPGPAQPPARRPCGTQPCLSWYTSSWREVRPGEMRGGGAGPWPSPEPSPAILPQCSEACGGGEQQRLVTCPEPGLCEEALRPHSTRPCNTQPCTQWVVGPWGQVSPRRSTGERLSAHCAPDSCGHCRHGGGRGETD